MTYKKSLALLALILFWGCSSEDSPIQSSKDVLIISEDLGNDEGGTLRDLNPFADTGTTEVTIKSYAYLPFASKGSECNAGAERQYFVLSDVQLECQDFKNVISAYRAEEEQIGVVIFEQGERDALKHYCFSDTQGQGSDCVDTRFLVQEDARGGMWSATLRGRDETRSFSTALCDAITRPSPKNISITDVAIYQAVKIPIVTNTQFVDNPNAPIISKRPALLRVFVNPNENWQPHEIVAKLTIGDLELEATLTPVGISNEGDKGTTFIFEFEEGELPTSGKFSVELFENQSCSDEGGDVGVTKVPRAVRNLVIKALNKSLDVVLVPIIYNYDGSGRMPNLDAATVKSYRDLMYEYYPVAELNVSVHTPVEYDELLGSRGFGFPAAINFCLNLRQVDGVPEDVFYYCVFKPADSFREYCGFSCRAGQSLIPSVDESESRGAIGVSYPRLAAATFVHEIGHAMGRNHSPCGRAPVPDPNYPHPGGSIGSVGYSVFSKLLFDGVAAKDFMAYCKPPWVSDYTYANIFTRLEAILGTQQGRILGPTRKWKSAIYENDFSLSWSINRELKSIPAGRRVAAKLYDEKRMFISDIEVLVREMADNDEAQGKKQAIFTIEYTEQKGTIEIEGYGTLISE